MPLIFLGSLIILMWYISHYQIKPDYDDYEIVEIQSLNRKSLVMYSQYSIFYTIRICGILSYKERFRNEVDAYLFPSKEQALSQYNHHITQKNEHIHST